MKELREIKEFLVKYRKELQVAGPGVIIVVLLIVFCGKPGAPKPELRATGNLPVNLEWTGAQGSTVKIYRSDALLEEVPNTGKYSDGTVLNDKSYTYKVCETVSTSQPNRCSNIENVAAVPIPTATPSPTTTATPSPSPIPTSTPTELPVVDLTFGGEPFEDGTTLPLGVSCTITAEADANTKSVIFGRDGQPKKTDSVVPFDYMWTPNTVGDHSFTATPYSGTNGSGTKGGTVTVNFVVTALSPTATPTPVPTPTPTPQPTATPQPSPTPIITPPPSPTPSPSPVSPTATPVPTATPTETPIGPAPTAPTELKARIIKGKDVELSWKDNSGDEVGFEIESAEKVGETCSGYRPRSYVPENTIQWVDEGTVKQKVYCFQVRAVGASGNKSAWSNATTIRP
jgi:hypothetical protein